MADTPLASDAPGADLVFHSHGHTLIPLLLGYTLCYILAQVLPTVALISQLPEAETAGRIFLLALFLPIYFIGSYLLDGRVRGVETVWHHPGGRVEIVTGGVWTGPWSTSLQLEDFACVVRREEHCHEEDGEEDCSDVFRPVLGGLDGHATVLAASWDQASAASRCTAFMELRGIHED